MKYNIYKCYSDSVTIEIVTLYYYDYVNKLTFHSGPLGHAQLEYRNFTLQESRYWLKLLKKEVNELQKNKNPHPWHNKKFIIKANEI